MTSIVLVSEVQLFLPESHSLKHKRAVLSSLKERLHNRFNVSVAEVDHNDLWQRSTLALAASPRPSKAAVMAPRAGTSSGAR